MIMAISSQDFGSSSELHLFRTKVIVFMLVGVATILVTRIFQTGSVLRTAVIFFYLSNEGISLLENASHLGLPIPTVVKKTLNQLHDKSENKENENEQQ
jgi:toxin secretion/phage lysis holin